MKKAEKVDDQNLDADEKSVLPESFKGIPMIPGDAHRFVEDPSTFKRVLKNLESKIDKKLDPKKTIYIGDQIYSDVTFANKFNFASVLVEPLDKEEKFVLDFDKFWFLTEDVLLRPYIGYHRRKHLDYKEQDL